MGCLLAYKDLISFLIIRANGPNCRANGPDTAKRQGSILSFFGNAYGPTQQKTTKSYEYWMSSLKSAHFVMIQYQTWPPQAILVSDWSISKKISPLKLSLAIWTETWYEASTCMEGSVLSFLKAEWKVSDTGSAHWASSMLPKSLKAKSVKVPLENSKYNFSQVENLKYFILFYP